MRPGGPACAAELDGFDGRLESNNTDSKTYTWGLEYREPLFEHFAASFVWLNEGHLPNNHRDGQAVQLWWHSKADPLGLVFEAGLGPYRYYDTHALNPDPEFHDAHGWGAIASAAADWYFPNHWFTYLRANEVSASDKYSSTALAVGVGYRFSSKFDLSPAASSSDTAPQAAPAWEVDGLLGERVGNTTHSETGLSEGLGARRSLSDHFTASVTFIAGQGTLLNWRDGFAAQLWLEQHLTSQLSVGVGAGGFIVSEDDSLQDADRPSNLSVIVSVTVAYSLTPHWLARVVWDRIGTGDDHDCDILQFGVGYTF
ncbi:MAG: hypothetical protein WBF21_00730 [Steroidobacteraceae bacterium]